LIQRPAEAAVSRLGTFSVIRIETRSIAISERWQEMKQPAEITPNTEIRDWLVSRTLLQVKQGALEILTRKLELSAPHHTSTALPGCG
jgi:hypothetical protein